MVLGLLRPADQERPEAVEPGVGGFEDPVAGAPTPDVQLELDLLCSGSHVRGVAALAGESAGAVGVVAAVERQPLRLLQGRGGSLDRDRVERRFEQLQVVAVGAVVRQPDRDPCRLAEKRTFRPFLARSVGFGPVASPPKGAFPVAPSQDSQSQSIPTVLS